MEYLDKIITAKPHEIDLVSVKDSKNTILQADDLFYIENRSVKGWISWGIGIFFMLTSFIFGPFEKGASFVIFLVNFTLGLFIFIYGFIAPKKEMVYNRMKGVITIARNLHSAKDIPFKQGYGVKVYYTATEGLVSSQLSFISSKKKPRVGGILSEHYLDEFWNFTIWFMDKNRPLPPGTAFNPYRERDFNRRKAEGFPKPLYPSDIKTPEATKQQQAERKLIGGW